MYESMLDDTDRKILEECIKNSRQSYREISRNIGVSPGTVVSRMNDMEDQGIIKKYTIQLDYEKLGYDLTAITEVTVSDGMIEETGKEIKKLSKAQAVYNITGDSDIIVIAKFRNRSELSKFTKTILKLQYVERTKTHLVLINLQEDFSMLHT
ncbi:MAG: Lrp/AsnC family transcriptional regulator [Candidatus Bathyarchaeia archaeon]